MALTEAEEIELLTLLEIEDAYQQSRLFYRLFPADDSPYALRHYPKQAAFFAASATHRELALCAGNRCITPWTPIEMVGATRLPGEILDATGFDVPAWDGGSRCTRRASGVVLKGIEPAFRLHLDNGQFFDCSRKHRVLTAAGWLSLGQLIQHASGLRCWRRGPDSPANCETDDYPGDLPLPWATDSVHARLPSASDVPLLLRLAAARADGAAHRSGYSHICPSYGRRAIPDDPHTIAALCAAWEDPAPALAAQWPTSIRQALAQYVRTYAQPLAKLSWPAHSLCVESYAPVGDGCSERTDSFLRHTLAAPDDVQCWSWKFPRQAMPGWWHDGARKEIFFPSSHIPLVGGQRIVSIVQIGLQPIVDFTVDDVHCYESGGVIHHNTGKTLAGLYALTCHLTGQYPAWWEGKRFPRPIHAVVAGDSSKTVREIVQTKLLGPYGRPGTGILPGATLRRVVPKPGVPEAVEMLRTTHVSGGESLLRFQSYDQGRDAFQGVELDVVLLDEEPPLAIYTEALVRTMTTNGLVMLTFTPLLGLSETVLQFLPDGQFPDAPSQGSKYVLNMTWDDVPHLAEAAKAELLASIPPYQREARTRGIPVLGSGVIYPVAEDVYLVEPFEIPKHWKRAYGMDVGWNRTAGMWGAYNPDTKGWTLYHEYYGSHQEPSVHASAFKAPGAWIPGVIDPAARGRSQADGVSLLETYTALGLRLSVANNAVEAGIYQVWEALSQGRLQVFRTLANWRKEIRLYRRDEKGHILKQNDHCLDCTRYLWLSGLEVARVVPVPGASRPEAERGLPTGIGWTG